jgi:hypothetical protein
MNRNDQDRFLDGLLAGDEVSDLRRASLERGLTLLRQRRRRKRALRACVLVGVPLALAAALVIPRAVPTVDRPVSAAGSNASGGSLALAKPAPVEIINDDELFALFPGRALALVGSPGHQRLIFLDEAVEPASQ